MNNHSIMQSPFLALSLRGRFTSQKVAEKRRSSPSVSSVNRARRAWTSYNLPIVLERGLDARKICLGGTYPISFRRHTRLSTIFCREPPNFLKPSALTVSRPSRERERGDRILPEAAH